MITLTLIIFLIYAFIEGKREGYYFHYKWKVLTVNLHDEHKMFTIQRSLVVLGMSMIGYPLIGWYCLLSILSMALCFSYIHNGAYYGMRNKLDSNIYPLGFITSNNTSTAKISMSYVTRTVLAVIGIVGATIFDVNYFIFLMK